MGPQPTLARITLTIQRMAGSMNEVNVRRTLVAALLVSGCHDLSEIRYETDEVRVGTYFGDELCAGDLRWIDDFVRRIEDDLDAESNEQIEIHLFDRDDNQSPRMCNGRSCYDVKNERVFSSAASLEHELVHAVADRVGRPADVLYTEGIPDALVNQRLVFGNTLPSDNLDRERTNLDDRTAGHFFRWLWNERDREGVRRLVRGELFADAYGFTFEEAEAAYLENAPWAYPRRWPCSAPPLASTGDHAWDETFTFDCDDEETFTIVPEDDAVPHLRRKRRTIRIENGGLYNLSGVEESIGILACQLERIDDAPADGASPPGETDPAAFAEAWGGVEYPIVGTDLVQIDFPPGEYELTIRDPAPIPGSSVRLIITPALQAARP